MLNVCTTHLRTYRMVPTSSTTSLRYRTYQNLSFRKTHPACSTMACWLRSRLDVGLILRKLTTMVKLAKMSLETN
jgi:hypothetical protein